jgi:hypothetical protein
LRSRDDSPAIWCCSSIVTSYPARNRNATRAQRQHPAVTLPRVVHDSEQVRTMTASIRPMITVTSRGRDAILRLRGPFGMNDFERLAGVLEDFFARGGVLSDVVLDLRGTTACSSEALVEVAALMEAGMRLEPCDRRARAVPRRRCSSHDRVSGL